MELYSKKSLESGDTNTGSERSMELVDFWLEDCTKNHARCSMYKGHGSPLPTRVLDVGPSDGSENLFLYVSKGEVMPYVALSHCWGKSGILTTTSKNISERRREIKINQSLATFRDAVDITRRLNIRYLWIDSLCIIQDSPEDWARESATMGTVYQKSFLTISAGESKDSTGGCFVHRGAKESQPCQLNMIFAELNEKRPVFACINGRTYHAGPLYQRAWVLQEEVLPTRNLIYSDDDIHWRCVTNHASGRNPVGSSLGSGRGSIEQFQMDIVDVIQLRRNSIKPKQLKDVYKDWYVTVAGYSTRTSTYLRDRLPALAGLASEMHKTIGDQYLAGLWKKDLGRGLLWRCSGDHGHRVLEGPGYIAPSWSWASVTGPQIVVNEMLRMDPFYEVKPSHFEILDAGITLKGPNDFGEVTSGFIRIKGLVKEAKYSPEVSKSEYEKEYADKEERTDMLEKPRGNLYDRFGERVVGIYEFDIVGCRPSSLWCISMLQEHRTWQRFLLLEPTKMKENRYRRVGLATIEDQTWFQTEDEKVIEII